MAKKWSKRFHWHVENPTNPLQCCYITQGVARLSEQTYIEHRGRKTSPLPLDIRKARLSTLRRHARIVQCLNEEMEIEPFNIEKVIRLGTQLSELKDKIASLGGVPKKWI